MADQEKGMSDIRVEMANLKEDLTKLRHDLGGLTKTVAGRGQESMKAVKESVESGIEKSVNEMSQCVQNRPMTSVLVAAGLGLVIGKLISLRS